MLLSQILYHFFLVVRVALFSVFFRLWWFCNFLSLFNHFLLCTAVISVRFRLIIFISIGHDLFQSISVWFLLAQRSILHELFFDQIVCNSWPPALLQLFFWIFPVFFFCLVIGWSCFWCSLTIYFLFFSSAGYFFLFIQLFCSRSRPKSSFLSNAMVLPKNCSHINIEIGW